MAKLERKTQKIFGANAGSTEIAAFGSIINGTPIYTDDIETLQTDKFEQGWNAAVANNNAPFMPEMTGVQNVFSTQLAYLFQQGIPEYDAGTTYYKNSWCQVDGTFYQSLTDDNSGNNPVNSTENWKPWQFIDIATDAEITQGESTNTAVTPKQLKESLENAIIGALSYQGTWNADGQTNYSNIELPVKAGYVYYVEGTTSIGGIDWETGDFLLINSDVEVGGSITDVIRLDHTFHGGDDINNPWSFGMSVYCPTELNNSSMLKSNGQWNLGSFYPSFYSWLQELRSAQEVQLYGFKSNTNYDFYLRSETPTVGAIVYGRHPITSRGVISSVSGNSFTFTPIDPDTGASTAVLTCTRDASYDKKDVIVKSGWVTDNSVDYSPKVLLKSELDNASWNYYSDYDYNWDAENDTFKLPLKNGEENLPSDKYVDLGLKESGSKYIIPANGVLYVRRTTENTDAKMHYAQIYIGGYHLYRNTVTTALSALSQSAPVNRGDIPTVTVYGTSPNENDAVLLFYAQGNGSLYYYVGDTLKNKEEIDFGAVTEALTNKVDTDLVNVSDNTATTAIDGQWVNTANTIASGLTAPTSNTSFSLASYLPNDQYNYEVLFSGWLQTAATTGKVGRLQIGTDIINSGNYLGMTVASTNLGVSTGGSIVLPVGTQRNVTIWGNSDNSGTITLFMRGYRRIGTNK